MYDWLTMAKEYQQCYVNTLANIEDIKSKQANLFAPAYDIVKNLDNLTHKEKLPYYKQRHQLEEQIINSQEMKALQQDYERLESYKAFVYLCRDYCLRMYKQVCEYKINKYCFENADEISKLKSNYKKFNAIVKKVLGEQWYVSIDERGNDTYLKLTLDFLDYKEEIALKIQLNYFADHLTNICDRVPIYSFIKSRIPKKYQYPIDHSPEEKIQAYLKYLEQAKNIISRCREELYNLEKESAFYRFNCTPLYTEDNDYKDNWKRKYSSKRWNIEIDIFTRLTAINDNIEERILE